MEVDADSNPTSLEADAGGGAGELGWVDGTGGNKRSCRDCHEIEKLEKPAKKKYIYSYFICSINIVL